MTTMTITQAAARLGRSYNQVLRLVLLGVLHGEQRHGHWSVSRDSVERLLAANPGPTYRRKVQSPYVGPHEPAPDQ